MNPESPFTTLDDGTDISAPPGFSSQLSSHVNGNALVIERRWLHTHAPWFLVMIFVLVWGFWMHYQVTGASGGMELVFYLLFFPITFYLFLAVVLNATTIQASPHRLVVQTRPFPLGFSTTVLESVTIRRVYYQEVMEDPEVLRTLYKVVCEGSDGFAHDIMGRLTHRAHAEYIAQQLDHYYTILQQGEQSTVRA